MKPAPAVTLVDQMHVQKGILLANRDYALDLIPRNGIVAEVGVAYGAFSRSILEKLSPSKFHAIDAFCIKPGDPEFWGMSVLKDSGLDHHEYYSRQFENEINSGLMHLHQGLSWDILRTFDDNYFDYVYLDAGHDYASAKRDTEELADKVKSGGFIQFNDYTLWSIDQEIQYGVIQVVNEFVMAGNHQIVAYCFNDCAYPDILVQVKK